MASWYAGGQSDLTPADYRRRAAGLAKAFSEEFNRLRAAPAGFEGATFTPLECVGARFNAMAVTYDGSGERAFLDQETDAREPAPLRHGVDQAVALFDDAAAAEALVTKSADQWRKWAVVDFTATFADGLPRPDWILG